MRHHGQSLFPRVFDIGRDYYEMEFLRELSSVSEHTLATMRYMLTRIWRRHYVVLTGDVLDHRHEKYVADRADIYEPRMKAWLDDLLDKPVTMVDHIHGDPTIENVMSKTGGGLVFIDPLPEKPQVPALMAVDLGKMLQSCWHYESLKGNRVGLTGNRFELSNLVLDRLTPSEKSLTTYFLCVHILRLIPYQHESKRMTFWLLFRSALDAYGPR
jgi:hypothetical protein